ncbi:MAG: hypothetical protein Q8918_11920 [Bacteroidota bacterium]|nr:hypothetical protein [Bacteroidota bacterium]MDP4250807.1 hypothetical protein [Bacteroidota bacterium]
MAVSKQLLPDLLLLRIDENPWLIAGEEEQGLNNLHAAVHLSTARIHRKA